MVQRLRIIIVAALTLVQTADAIGQEITCGCAISENRIIFKGTAEVLDGDTIWIGIHKVRLSGIDALEEKQPCTKSNQRFRCYEKALFRLKELIAAREVTCRIDRVKFGKPAMDRNRYLGTCNVGDIEINRTLVAEGWVVAAEGSLGDVYRDEEKAASDRKLGLHQTAFDPPWVYRHKKRQKIVQCPSGTHQCVAK